MNKGRFFLPFSIWYEACSLVTKSKNEIESEKNSCDEPGTVRPTD